MRTPKQVQNEINNIMFKMAHKVATETENMSEEEYEEYELIRIWNEKEDLEHLKLMELIKEYDELVKLETIETPIGKLESGFVEGSMFNSGHTPNLIIKDEVPNISPEALKELWNASQINHPSNIRISMLGLKYQIEDALKEFHSEDLIVFLNALNEYLTKN